MVPSHRAAMAAMEAGRTAALGGHISTGAVGATTRYRDHSCTNRHGPTCQPDSAQAWLARQQDLLLPAPSFLVTCTRPAALRDLARSHQRQRYARLVRAAAAALQPLAHDPRFLGGQIGMLGVVQTWTRDVRVHPHVPYLAPAIALAPDGTVGRPRNSAVLAPVTPLALLLRATLRAALRQTDRYTQVAPATWQQAWVIACRPVGSGAAALPYLAPDIFRVALSNNRIIGIKEDRVTFRYRAGDTKQVTFCTVPALTFIGRVLQHVLPKGFVKVRA